MSRKLVLALVVDGFAEAWVGGPPPYFADLSPDVKTGNYRAAVYVMMEVS